MTNAVRLSLAKIKAGIATRHRPGVAASAMHSASKHADSERYEVKNGNFTGQTVVMITGDDPGMDEAMEEICPSKSPPPTAPTPVAKGVMIERSREGNYPSPGDPRLLASVLRL